MPPSGVARTTSRSKPIIGWREWVSLGELSPEPIKAKVDTGARTSALHAHRMRVDGRADGDWVTFELHPRQRSGQAAVAVEAPVAGWRDVRSSNGQLQRRPVIEVAARLGDTDFPVELTLTDRDEMGFRMLLGRAAVRRRFLVDPGRSFLRGARP